LLFVVHFFFGTSPLLVLRTLLALPAAGKFALLGLRRYLVLRTLLASRYFLNFHIITSPHQLNETDSGMSVEREFRTLLPPKSWGV
jgi:hypothetical protein